MQITVRLPDDQVAYLDSEVAGGRATSRAAGIARALRHEQRRQQYERDLEIVLAAGEDPELAGLRDWVAGRSYPEID